MTSGKHFQRHVVEFTHPGREYIPKRRGEDTNVIWSNKQKRSGIRLWNELETHKRKFLRSRGKLLDDLKGRQRHSEFTYWGEWEAHSCFTHSGLPQDESPQFIHKPFLDRKYNGGRRHNTDPFVFGEHFWYTNCKQQHRKFLTRLDVGSVILFGTEVADGFLLDTVFVVERVFRPPLPFGVIDSAPVQLRETNFLHTSIGKCSTNARFTFYRGLNYGSSPRFFSFVPCRPFIEGVPVPHERPVLDPGQFELQNPGARTVCARLLRDQWLDGSLPLEAAENYWRRIVDACLDQGFSLAVQIELPMVSGQRN